MHRIAEKRRRWRLWEKNEKYNTGQVVERRADNFHKSGLDARFCVSIRANKFQIKREVGAIEICYFCGSRGSIVEKFPRRGYRKFGVRC